MFLLSGTDETEPYAARRYRKGLRSYRRAIRRPFLLVFGFPLLASLVVEDVETGHGNYDHILVGPAGVYFLETKNPTGIVEVRDGQAWLRRRHDPEGERRLELQRQVRGGSAKVFDEIERRCGQRVWVNAVVVSWSDFPQEVVEVDKITYVHGSKLRAWLHSRPDRLDPSAVADIAGALAAMKVEGDIAAEQREASPSSDR